MSSGLKKCILSLQDNLHQTQNSQIHPLEELVHIKGFSHIVSSSTLFS